MGKKGPNEPKTRNKASLRALLRVGGELGPGARVVQGLVGTGL